MFHRAGMVAVLAMVAGATPAEAGQWIQPTDCQSVEIEGVSYPMVTFTVTNLHPVPRSIC